MRWLKRLFGSSNFTFSAETDKGIFQVKVPIEGRGTFDEVLYMVRQEINSKGLSLLSLQLTNCSGDGVEGVHWNKMTFSESKKFNLPRIEGIHPADVFGWKK